jgi:hypothetical protein
MKSALTAFTLATSILALTGTALADPPAVPQTGAQAGPQATPPAPQAKPNHVCLSAGDIDHTSYPDNSTILFHMKGGKVRIWRNDLKHECPGLKFEQGIAYEIRGGTICSNMQVVYVINRWTPCMLGPFTPYTPPPKPAAGAK